MKVRQYVIEQTKRNEYVERIFNRKIRKALELTIEPAIDIIATDFYNAEQRIGNVLKPNHIEAALRWLYVEWGYSNMIWFSQNLPFQKKDFWQDVLSKKFAEIGAEKVTEILGTTLKLIKPQIKEAINLASTGASIDSIRTQIIKNVKGQGGAMSRGRAQLIARTEVIGASNMSTYEAASQSGVKLMKKWSTGGRNIRETHKAAARVGYIPMDQDFTVGNYHMAHPGDPRGGASEVCNCKCILIYRVAD